MKHVVVLGPCPCRGCGESVYWDGWGWRNVWRNVEHLCSVAPLSKPAAGLRQVRPEFFSDPIVVNQPRLVELIALLDPRVPGQAGMKRPVVLGPCPCRGCGESVYWDGWGWRNVRRNVRRDAEHGCPNRRGRAVA